MADTPLSTGIGQGSAQVWQSNLTNQAFNDVVRQQRLDNAAEAEAARRQAAIDAKNAENKRRFMKNELDGIVPDLGKIWESRDGDYIRNEANQGFMELIQEPGFTEALFNNDPDAMSKLQLFKSDIAGMVNKSIQDKTRAKDWNDVVDPYMAASNNGLPYEDQRYYAEDLDRLATGFNTPLGDLSAPIERTDSLTGWEDFYSTSRDNYAKRNRGERTYQNPVTRIITKTSGTQRPDKDRWGDVDTFWDQLNNKRDAFARLGIPWTSTGDVPEGYEDIWDNFRQERFEETFYDDRDRSVTGVIDIDEGSQEEVDAYNRIDEMTQALQKASAPKVSVNQDLSSPAYTPFHFKSGTEKGQTTYGNHFEEGEVFGGHFIVEPPTDELKNMISVMERSPRVRRIELVTSGKGHNFAVIDSQGNASLVEPAEYATIAGMLADGEGIEGWSLEKQDAMNKGQSDLAPIKFN